MFTEVNMASRVWAKGFSAGMVVGEVRWWSAGLGVCLQRCSHTQAVATDQARPSAPRTSVTNPSQHTTDHRGLWYTLEPDTVKRLFSPGGIPRQYSGLCRTFGETCLMVRQPALTTIDYIKRSNLTLPPNKFMLYGEAGVGKTMSLVHITHFLAEDGWILLHVALAPQWRRGFREVAASSTVPDLYDHHFEAVVWLQQFKSQNADLLSELQLTTSERYEWSRRETTEAGEPLVALVDLGIARARFASACVMGITTELKRYASQSRCKVALIIDGINTFFCNKSRFRLEDRSFLPPQKFTLYRAFSQFFTMDWTNGVIVGSIDKNANDGERRKSHLPRYVLRQKGWETLDPFVPILVSDYDDVEMRSVVDYYLDRQWLQCPDVASDTGRGSWQHSQTTTLSLSCIFARLCNFHRLCCIR